MTTLVATNVSAHYGSGGHGLILKVEKPAAFNPSKAIGPYKSLYVNVYGDIWKSAPAGVETLAKWSFLPYWVKSDSLDQSWLATNSNSSLRLEMGNDYKVKVSHATMNKTIADAATGNDYPFLLEFASADGQEHYFDVYTRPSLIQASLQNPGQNCVMQFPPKISKTAGQFAMYLRWWLFPMLFTTLLFTLLFSPATVLSAVPVIWAPGTTTETWTSALPPYPKTMLQAWELSRLDYQLTVTESGGNDTKVVSEILLQASKVLDRNLPLTVAELHSVIQYVENFEENNKGIFSRIYGFFSFVNILWIAAIVGITISIGPVIWHVLAPFRRLLWRLCMFVVEEIILRLHKWGVFEALAYVVCSLFVIEGMRQPIDRGFFFCLTGLLLILPSYFYSCVLHAKVKLEKETLLLIATSWCSLWWIPMAMGLQSYSLAWLSCFAFFASIWIFMAEILRMRNWHGDWEVAVWSYSSLTIVGSWLLLRAFTSYSRLFASPATISGSFVLYMTLLIYSSYYWGQNFTARQVPFWVAVFAGAGLGSILFVEPLVNCSVAFSSLWVVIRYIEFHCENRWNLWVLVFVVSIAFWRGALFLHSHPELVTGIFL